MAVGVVDSSWRSASMQLHGADHTSLSGEFWMELWLSTLSGVRLRARIAPSYRYELLDLTFLFPNSHLLLGWRLWFCFVCLFAAFLGLGAKFSFGGLRCILVHLFNMVKNPTNLAQTEVYLSQNSTKQTQETVQVFVSKPHSRKDEIIAYSFCITARFCFFKSDIFIYSASFRMVMLHHSCHHATLHLHSLRLNGSVAFIHFAFSPSVVVWE